MTIDERLQRVFKAYDVRGRVGVELDDAVVAAIGTAAATVMGDPQRPFVVGRDMRASSQALADAFITGVTSAGVDVIDIGLASTDQLYFASGTYDAPGAMVTASHNPAAYNGIKLCGRAAAPISERTGLMEIRDRASECLAAATPPYSAATDASDGIQTPSATPRGECTTVDTLAAYAEHVRSFVDTSAIADLHVVVDAGNGMAGLTWPTIAEPLEIRTTPLYFTLDGTFPHHPADPLNPDNLRDLQREVVATGAAVGLAFDGDADRVFAVDERGQRVEASLLGALIAERTLQDHPGATVLHSLICSQVVADTIRAAGGQPVRTRVGHSFIKEQMAATDAVVAVEHSGHYYFRDNFRADSGAIAALLLLEILATADEPLSQLIARYDRFVRSGELNFTVDDPVAAVARVRDHYSAHDLEDGVTVTLESGWFNVRTSNTEPVVRLNVEAADQATLRSIVDAVTTLLEGE